MARQKYIKEVSYERVRELFDYNPESGEVVRKCDVFSPRNGNKVASKGDTPGYMSNQGYYNIKVDGRCYRLHRIIWLWYYKVYPENDIDHINRDRADNRIDNLREVSRPCNVHNGKVRNDSTTGITGVSMTTFYGKTLFTASIQYKNLTKSTYVYKSYDFIEAVAHRLAAEQCLSDVFCNCKSSAEIFMENYLNEVKDSF